MSNKFVGAGKLFFRGFSKVFKGPQDSGKVATIGGVKPKAKVSDSTKKFKARVKGIKEAVKRGTDSFKKENPKSLVTDKQIKTIQKETTEKNTKKYRKEFLREKKAFGGLLGKKKKSVKPKKPNPDSIKQKILPKKKKDRLDELRKDLGLKKGGKVKKKFPDLTGDGKVTKADILKGRGVFGAGGGVRGSSKGSDIYSRIKQRERLKQIRKKFGGGKK